MTREEQLAWEKRAGRPAAVAAFASALLGAAALAVGTALQQKGAARDTVEELLRYHRYPGVPYQRSEFLATAALQALSILLLSVPLWYLYRATKFRRPELPGAAFYLAIVMPPALAVLTLLNAVERIHAADRVVPRLPLPHEQALKLADHEITHGAAATVGWAAIGVAILLAFAIGIISMNARRAGLLSGFMGILGVIVGVLFVLAVLGPPIVQYFWVTALGLLFLDRWPGQQGRGPAWDSGEAIPWPTAQQLQAERAGGGGGRSERAPARRAEQDARGPEPGEADDAYEDEPQPAGTPHPRSKKRKRKRRR